MGLCARTVTTIGVVAAFGLATAPRADAGLVLAATIGGADFCAVDNNAVCTFGTQILDTDLTAGVLNVGGVPILVGGLLVSGSLHQQTIGSRNILNSSSLEIENTTGATVTGSVAVGGTSFTGVSNAFSTASGTWELATGSTIDLEWWLDTANAQGGADPSDRPGVLFDSFNQVSGPVLLESFAHNGGPFPAFDLGLYSMTLGIDLSLVSGGRLLSRGQSAIGSAQAVPEPTSTALLGVGLGMLALATRRRRRS